MKTDLIISESVVKYASFRHQDTLWIALVYVRVDPYDNSTMDTPLSLLSK